MQLRKDMCTVNYAQSIVDLIKKTANHRTKAALLGALRNMVHTEAAAVNVLATGVVAEVICPVLETTDQELWSKIAAGNPEVKHQKWRLDALHALGKLAMFDVTHDAIKVGAGTVGGGLVDRFGLMFQDMLALKNIVGIRATLIFSYLYGREDQPGAGQRSALSCGVEQLKLIVWLLTETLDGRMTFNAMEPMKSIILGIRNLSVNKKNKPLLGETAMLKEIARVLFHRDPTCVQYALDSIVLLSMNDVARENISAMFHSSASASGLREKLAELCSSESNRMATQAAELEQKI